MTVADRLIVTAPNVLERWRTELPEPGPSEVIVRTLVSLVSAGTELHILHGDKMSAAVWADASDLDLVTAYTPGKAPAVKGVGDPRYPATLGYNSVGVIERVGPGVPSERVGEVVMAAARHQSLYRIEAWEAVPVPAGVDPAAAAFAYLATLGLHALRRADYKPGQRVAVLGAGVVGGLAALVARAVGAADVTLVEPRASRRDLFAGIDGIRVCDPGTAEAERADAIDVVVEAAGSAAALATAMALVAPRGAIAVVALHPEPLGPLFDGHMYAKQPRLIGCANDPYAPSSGAPGKFTVPDNVAYVLDLLRRDLLPAERLITHRLPAARAEDAYAALTSDESACGVLLDWQA